MASCAMPAGPGMNIKTDTPLVKKAREGVMEFMLVGSISCLSEAASSPPAAPLALCFATHKDPPSYVMQGS